MTISAGNPGLYYDNVRKAWVLGSPRSPKLIIPDSNTRQSKFMAGVGTILPVQVASGTITTGTLPIAAAVIGDHVLLNLRTVAIRPIAWVRVASAGLVHVAFAGGCEATATQPGIACDWMLIRHE